MTDPIEERLKELETNIKTFSTPYLQNPIMSVQAAYVQIRLVAALRVAREGLQRIKNKGCCPLCECTACDAHEALLKIEKVL